MTGWRAIATVAAALLAIGACTQGATFAPIGPAYGRVETAEDAAAAARFLSDLAEPITTWGIRSGSFRQLNDAALGGLTDEAAEQLRLKLDRPAWIVQISGTASNGSCCRWRELIIDRETGSVLSLRSLAD